MAVRVQPQAIEILVSDWFQLPQVAARGIDVPCINTVINYDMPNTLDQYVHRIGRTGIPNILNVLYLSTSVKFTDHKHFRLTAVCNIIFCYIGSTFYYSIIHRQGWYERYSNLLS